MSNQYIGVFSSGGIIRTVKWHTGKDCNELIELMVALCNHWNFDASEDDCRIFQNGIDDEVWSFEIES